MPYDMAVAEGLNKIAMALNYLGTGHNSSDMGAVEFLATEIKEGLMCVSDGLKQIAEAMEAK